MKSDSRPNDPGPASMMPTAPGETPFREDGAQAALQAMSRRAFLHRLALTLTGLGALPIVTPVLGFLLAPLLRQPPAIWRPIGRIADYASGSITEVAFLEASPLPWAGVTAMTAAWLRKVSETEVICFTVSCSHLGCPVWWQAEAGLFLCPCHGRVYDADGAVAAGPPPHGLGRYQTRLRNGLVEVNVSSKPEPLPDQHGAP